MTRLDPLFEPPGRHYAYTPSMLVSGGVEHCFYCRSGVEGLIEDHVYLRRRGPGSDWSPPERVLAPGLGWDAKHVCDPAVVRGTFSLEGERFGWAMFYLGSALTPGPNQIGVAFAHSLGGPWVRSPSNPVVRSEERDHWGVGQPSVTAVGGGRVLLFYTQGDARGTRCVALDLDLSDGARPRPRGERVIPVSGLQRRDGRSAPMLRGADFLYLPARDGQGAGFAMVAGLEPFARADSRRSPGISEELGLAWLGEEDLWAGEGSWTPLARIRRDRTGYAFNFDAALVRDAYGQLPAGAPLTVVASVARRAPGRDLALWSYRLVSVACG